MQDFVDIYDDENDNDITVVEVLDYGNNENGKVNSDYDHKVVLMIVTTGARTKKKTTTTKYYCSYNDKHKALK